MNKLKSDIKILTVLIVVENYLCVYRNFSTLGKVNQVLVITRLTIAYMLYTTASAYEIYMTFISIIYDNTMLFIYNTIYTILTTAITLFNFYVGVRQAKTFQGVILKLDQVHRSCKDGKVYIKELHKFTIKSIINATIIFVTFFIIFVVILINFEDSSIGNYILNGSITVLNVWRELQFFVELFCFHSLIQTMTLALKHVKAALMESLKSASADEHGDLDGMQIDCAQLRKTLEMAIPTFNLLKNCSDDLKTCFGVQIVFSLFNLSVFYIFLCYRAITSIMSRVQEYSGRPSHVITIFQLINYMGSIVSTLYAGQVAHNAMNDLSRSVARLYNKLHTTPSPEARELQKTVKDFHRQMVIEPVAFKVLSKLPMQMPLLLQILSTIISYTIITLQFNHVV